MDSGIFEKKISDSVVSFLLPCIQKKLPVADSAEVSGRNRGGFVKLISIDTITAYW